MIALLRKIFLEDFWLKLFSLALALLIWLTVTFASKKELGTAERVFKDLPIRLVASAEDVHNFKVNPGQVEITLQGDPAMLQDLQSEDIQALVDLTGVPTARDLHKPVEVAIPPGVTCVRISPDEVQVIFPPER